MSAREALTRAREAYDAHGVTPEPSRAFRALMRELRAAREAREPWYQWIADGMPTLTVEEYEAQRSVTHNRRRNVRE